MILDTSAISDLLRGVAQIRAIVEDCQELAFPVVSRDTHFDHVEGLRRIGW